MELSESHDKLKSKITYNGFAVDATEIQKLYSDLNAGEDKILPNLKTIGEDKYDFQLKFRKADNGNVYLNGFTAIDKTDNSKQQFFSMGKDTLNITSKEAYNLMEGRSVFKKNSKDANTINPIWVKLDFSNKNENGQAKYKTFGKSYGFFPERMLAKMGIDMKYKKDLMKSLKKGNEVKVTLQLKDDLKGGTVLADPQAKKIHFTTERGVSQGITSNINEFTANYLISNPKKQESFINSCTNSEVKKLSSLIKNKEKDIVTTQENTFDKTQITNISNLLSSKLEMKKNTTKDQGVAV